MVPIKEKKNLDFVKRKKKDDWDLYSNDFVYFYLK